MRLVETVLEPTVPKLLRLLATRRFLCEAVPLAPSVVPEIRLAPVSTTTLLTPVVAFRATVCPVLMVTVGVEPDGGVAVLCQLAPSYVSQISVVTVEVPQ